MLPMDSPRTRRCGASSSSSKRGCCKDPVVQWCGVEHAAAWERTVQAAAGGGAEAEALVLAARTEYNYEGHRM